MSTRRIEQAVVEPAETVKQETKFRVDKLRAKCMQLFHVTSSTFDGAMYGCTATEKTLVKHRPESTNGLERSDKTWQEVLLIYPHRR